MQAVLDKKRQGSFDIRDVIRNKRIIVHFQPVISLIRKKVLGVEGLVRGLDADTGQVIAPIELFHAAANEGLTVELDRLCREKVIGAFRDIYENTKDTLLFLNVDASILDKVGGSMYLLNQVHRNKINPNNIVIEVNEIKVQDNTALKSFINVYREYGFLIALDDVGAGCSNLDRIPLAKPDIIKTDMSLIRNIDSDYHKQEVFKSVINLANTIGALVVAEGVETAEEAVQILIHGGHIIQGYYFSKPKEIYRETEMLLNEKIEILSNSFKEYMQRRIREEKHRHRNLGEKICDALTKLAGMPRGGFNKGLSDIICVDGCIECAYILDGRGIQVSDTICCSGIRENLIFYLARPGTDHSMKKYYYHLVNARSNKYVTEPYVSLASGNLCITYSRVFKNVENKRYILCVDFKAKQ